MPLVVKDRVRETSTTAGTGTFTLAGAVTGYQSFSAIGNGNTTYYTIYLQGGNEWEVGIGTYTASGTTLSRDTILASSNGGSAVNFSAGVKDVFVTYPAGRSVYYDTATNVTLNALTLSGGTQNGVLYLNASRVATSGSALTFDGTKLNAASSVDGPVSLFGVSNATTGGGSTLNIAAASTEYALPSVRGDTVLRSESNSLVFGTASEFKWGSIGAEWMRLTSTGLGIGTSSPSEKLTVAGAGLFTSNLSNYRTSSLALDFFSGTSRIWAFGANASTAGTLQLYTASNDGSVVNTLTYTSSGNLGLGVTPKTDWSADYDAFQLGGGSSLSGHTSTSLNFTVLASNQYLNTAGTAKFINDGYAPRYLQRGDTGEHYWYTTNNGLANGNVVNTQAMTLLANGNLGIGETNPAARLDVRNGVAGEFVAVNALNTLGDVATATSSTIRLGITNSAGVSYATIKAAETVNDDYPSLVFGVQNIVTTNPAERMKIDPSGTLILRQSSNAANTSVSFNTTVQNALTLDSDGDLGIGTNLPQFKLDVFGKQRIYLNNTSVGNASSLQLTQDGTGDAAVSFLIGATTEWLVGVDNSASDAFKISNITGGGDFTSTGIVLDSSGNLGLGVTPSGWGGQVLCMPNGGAISFSGAAGGAITANTYYSGGWKYLTAGAASYYNQSNGEHQWFRSTSAQVINTDPVFSQAMTLDASGNLLVGTTSPTYGGQLTVRGAGATVASFMNSNFVAATSGTQLNINVGATTGNTNFQLQVTSGGGLAFNDLALQPSGGNVGVGTTSPGANLDVRAAVTANIRLGSTGGDLSNDTPIGALEFFNSDANQNAVAARIQAVRGSGFGSGGLLTFSTSETGSTAGALTERARITSVGGFETKPAANGHAVFNEDGVDADFRVEGDTDTHLIFADASTDRVGIGTNNPGYKFDVNGNFGLGTGQTGNVGVFGANTATADTYFRLRNTAGTFDIGTAAGGHYLYGAGSLPLQFFTDATERARITSIGGFETRPAASGHAVFNEDGVDADFRVESDTNTHALFVDAGNNAVGVSTAAPASGVAGYEGLVGFGTNGKMLSAANASVAASGYMDITLASGGGSFAGFLTVNNVYAANAAERTQVTYSIFGRGTNSFSAQLIATDNGSTGGMALSISNPSDGVIRITNDAAVTTYMTAAFFGATGF